MNLAFRKDRVLSVHKLIKQNTQRVGIVFCVFSCRLGFEISMVKVRHICPLSKYFCQRLVHRWNLPDFGDAILQINAFNVKKIERGDGRSVDELQRFD
jgi:hypothetical protein